MTKLIKMNLLKNNDSLIYKFKNKDLMIYEDIQGSKIYVKFNGVDFEIKPKSYKNDPLNFVDLSTQIYYNCAYNYINSLSNDVKNLLNNNWYYCFEYFPDNQPANIKYSKLPKNNLILTSIIKNTKHNFNLDELIEYAKLFGVDSLPVLFKGKLSAKQIEILILFLNTSTEDLEFVFGESNFAHFFYKILNPLVQNSFLMNDGEFNENLEKIIFKLDGDPRFSFEFLNPLYNKQSDENSTEYTQIYSLILLNFIEFCQINGFEKYKPANITKEQLYVDLICLIFNDYLANVKDDLINWDFVVPKFFTEDKFKVNYNNILNKKTLEYIKSDIKLEYIFKVILNSFMYKKKKTIGIFSDKTLKIFNQIVDKIDNYLNLLLNINSEYIDDKSTLINFNDYFNLDYNVDYSGRIYLDDDKIKPDEEVRIKNKKTENDSKKNIK